MEAPIAYKRYVRVLMACAFLGASSCKKDEAPILPEALEAASLEVPANFPKAPQDPDNPLTKQGIVLGRLLFYDTRLSGSNKLSCASCHKPELAFSDGIALTSIGESGIPLPRHSPALINLAWANNGLFWDGGSTNLESQAFAPLTSPDEMHQNLSELEYELKQVPDYVNRFKLVFGSEIKSNLVVKALAQFERTLISGNSRYDRYIRKEPNASLTSLELDGMALVNSKCGGCHSGVLFTDNGYHNNGLDSDFSNDTHDGIYQGRYRISYDPADKGKFKTPTLRNVMLTAPYMHDGRFASLDAVLEHYNKGIKPSPTLDALARQSNGQAGIPLTAGEKAAITAFLQTLTDDSFISSKKLNNPNQSK